MSLRLSDARSHSSKIDTVLDFCRMQKSTKPKSAYCYSMIGRKGLAGNSLKPGSIPNPRPYWGFALPFVVKNVQILV